MIPILYDKDEVGFDSNGLGRLRDCISCIVTEERNGRYECDFEYPVTGANYDLIQLGRIIGVSHDDTGDIQPFDIVSFTRPIDGIVMFHSVHISYRQSYMTVRGGNVQDLEQAFQLCRTGTTLGPQGNPFTYWTDKDSTGYLPLADQLPHTVKSMLGGTEGSILDTYGGEYEWDRFNVKLHSARGQDRDLSVRYGVNMLDYNDDCDISGSYMSCFPYWTDGVTTILGDVVDSGGSTITGRGECIPLDVTERFESQPTKAEVEAMALSIMNSRNACDPAQTISVSFVRLQDIGEFQGLSDLLQCRLCDRIKVVFPDYGTTGRYKIVKTAWDVLEGRYDEMELGDLSISLSEALGIDGSSSYSGSSGGSGGGVSSYNDLADKPSIEGVTLSGNKTFPALKLDILSNSEIQDIFDNLN